MFWVGFRQDLEFSRFEFPDPIPRVTVRDAIAHLSYDEIGDTNPSPSSVERWKSLKPGEKEANTRRSRLEWDKQSPTLTAGHIEKRGTPCWPLHPDHNRVITVREGLLITTLPEDYRLPRQQYMQRIGIGNAVPPKLAEAIALEIKKILEIQK
jgi:DNA (cytosine-5)-methyltransferase 1